MVAEDFSEQMIYEKTKYQKRALCRKIITVQSRMKQTFALQIFIPVFGLAVMSLIRDILAANADVLANQKVEIPIPHFFNLPLKSFKSLGLFFNITECDEFYLY